MKAKKWLSCWILIVCAFFITFAYIVCHVDPYFHYHKPYTERYFYYLDREKQRSQNDGISKHFEYNAMITGTSMTDNFLTSEMDELFGCSSVKLPFSGGSYKEINDNLTRALKANPDLRTVVRCLDTDYLLDSADYLKPRGTVLGDSWESIFPAYLYDNDPFNDVEYLLDWNLICKSIEMIAAGHIPGGGITGITPFDEYCSWQNDAAYGKNEICPSGISVKIPEEFTHLTEDEKKVIEKNITKNVTDLADDNPDVDFYYYFSPYSILRWLDYYSEGSIYRFLEAKEAATELILQHENIRLFSFNTRFDIITDLNNYPDVYHYAGWVNSLILKWLHDGSYRLTKDNYEEYFREEYEFYLNFDYESLNSQEDYEADYYAGALLNSELTGAEPLDLLASGSIEKTPEGGWITVDLSNGHNYLMYISNDVKIDIPAVYVYDEAGDLVGREGKYSSSADGNIHMHVIDLSEVKGTVTVIFRGSFEKNTVNGSSEGVFYDIFLY